MGSLGFFLSQLIYQLPMLAVVVVGLALIPSRRARIGARRANLAMGGLFALLLELVISIGWSSFATFMIMDRTVRMSTYTSVAPVISIFLVVLTATAVALLLAAIVAPGPDPTPATAPTAYAPPTAHHPTPAAEPPATS